MSAITGALAEQVAVAAVNTGTASSTPLAGTAADLSKFDQVAFIFCLGDMASETIDCIVESCDSNGANNASLKAATQLAAHASNNDSKQIVINVRASDLIASGKRYARGKITTGGATGGTCTIVAVGGEQRNPPTDVEDASSVVEIKL